MLACREGDLQVVKLLIANNVNVYLKNSTRNTALHYAVMQAFQSDDAKEIVRILLEAGLSPVDENKHQMSPWKVVEMAKNDVLIQIMKPYVED